MAFFFGDAARFVEPIEFVDAMIFGIESLQHNTDAIAYMLELAHGGKHGRADAWDVADELGVDFAGKQK